MFVPHSGRVERREDPAASPFPRFTRYGGGWAKRELMTVMLSRFIDTDLTVSRFRRRFLVDAPALARALESPMAARSFSLDWPRSV